MVSFRQTGAFKGRKRSAISGCTDRAYRTSRCSILEPLGLQPRVSTFIFRYLSHVTLKPRRTEWIDWLQATLNVRKSQLRRIVERSLESSIDNIQSILELSDKELTQMIGGRQMCCNATCLLKTSSSGYHCYKNYYSIYEWWTSEALKNTTRVRQTYCFGWKRESMKESQQWMQQRFGLHVSDAKIAQMCRNTCRSQLLH